MRTFTYWIQHADFTTTDGSPVSAAQAIQAFAGHDWDAVLLAASDLARAGAKDVCEPGIGFHPDEPDTDLLLHVRPRSWDKADVDYLYPKSEKKKRLFGLFSPPVKVASATHAGFPIERVHEAIELFMSDRHDDLLDLLSK